MKTLRNNLISISLLIVIIAAIYYGCKQEEHFITDRNYRKLVVKDYNARKRQLNYCPILDIVKTNITLKEKEALKFLYAYMPLADIAEQDGDFYLRNIQYSFMAKETFPWGEKIPEDIFRHFVLPLRVNNEPIDSSRMVFFNILKDRIKDMNMAEAALEVNRWCHEKVTYRATDSRTSGPLHTVNNAFGRCGEESTFTVAAMRSVGIPARQVYTPRWAHSDDNHAWVEVWIDSTWNYVGACEPEPVLNKAWFSEPVERAMLVHARVFGKYFGDEPVIYHENNFAVLNTTANYTDVAYPVVTVVSENGKPQKNIEVKFLLYNYAELYPIASVKTDESGKVTMALGKGDILISAGDGVNFAWKKSNLRNETNIRLTLKPLPALPFEESWLFNVPGKKNNEKVILPEEVLQKHKMLITRGDSIRNSYVNSFINEDSAVTLAHQLKINPDTTWFYLKESYGNWRNIADFMVFASKDHKPWLFKLLQVISKKDLRDIHFETLKEHLVKTLSVIGKQKNSNTKQLYKDSALVAEYIMNPRIYLENTGMYKNRIFTDFSIRTDKKYSFDADGIKTWIIKHIEIDSTPSYSRVIIKPTGVNRLLIADPLSRDIFFVAACRSIGLPARLDPVTLTPQVYSTEGWRWYCFDDNKKNSVKSMAKITLTGEPGLKYYNDFTIARLKKDEFSTLEFPWAKPLEQFSRGIEVEEGVIAVISGVRLPDGNVMTTRKWHNLRADEETEIFIAKPSIPAQSYGKLPSIVYQAAGKETEIKPGSFENYLIIAAIDEGSEPCKHFLKELNELASKKNTNEMPEILIIMNATPEKTKQLIRQYELTGTVKLIDSSPFLLTQLRDLSGLALEHHPVIAGFSNQLELFYIKEGYNINTVGYIDKMLAP